MFLDSIFWWMGLLVFLKFMVITYQFIFPILFMRQKDLADRYGKSSWVFITGSSEGIGLEYARQLASKGFNIIISGRSQKKLIEALNQLKLEFQDSKFKSIQTDFSKSTSLDYYDKIFDQLEGLDISILINNVGVMLGRFMNNSEQDILDTSVINVLPQAILTKRFLHQFYLREKRSAIISVGSMFSEFSSAGNSVYAATKIFSKWLSVGEGRNHTEKIDFLCAEPGYCQTNMMQGVGNALFGSTPEITVRQMLKALGNRDEYSGYWRHEFLMWLIRHLPLWMPDYWVL